MKIRRARMIALAPNPPHRIPFHERETNKTKLKDERPWPAPTQNFSEIVRLVKANSSKWINEPAGSAGRFEWQSGYGAFSVSVSQSQAACEYVRSQEEHHRVKTFQEEYQDFLRRHEITFEERYLWG